MTDNSLTAGLAEPPTDDNRSPIPGLVIGWGATALFAGFAAFWDGGIAMDLIMVIMAGFGLFTEAVLPFELDPMAAALRFAALALAGYLGWRTLRRHRAVRGACRRCGRSDRPVRDLRRIARRAAYLSILPATGYAVLKVTWAFGGTIGLDDPGLFGDVTPLTPGFLDTAIMAAIGIGLAVAMTHRWRLPRFLLLAPALIGLAMLLPVSVWGNIHNLVGLFAGTGDSMGMSAWVGWFVYGCFALWAVCLLTVTVDYIAATAKACRECGHAGYARIAT